MVRNKVFITLLSVLFLAYSGCQETDKLSDKSVSAPSDNIISVSIENKPETDPNTINQPTVTMQQASALEHVAKDPNSPKIYTEPIPAQVPTTTDKPEKPLPAIKTQENSTELPKVEDKPEVPIDQKASDENTTNASEETPSLTPENKTQEPIETKETPQETTEPKTESPPIDNPENKPDTNETQSEEPEQSIDKSNETEVNESSIVIANETLDNSEEPEEIKTINHDFDLFFKRFINEDGNIDYSYLRRKRGSLYEMVRLINDFTIEDYSYLDPEDQIAFWINSHNLLTLNVIIKNYPIESNKYKLLFYPPESIMQLDDPRNKIYFRIMEKEYSLYEIENKVIPRLYDDPKIFFALSYASNSSAILKNETYIGKNLEEQLDEQVRDFLKRENSLIIDRSNNTVFLSDIFNWYRPFFVTKYKTDTIFRGKEEHIRAYLNFIERYVSEDKANYLKHKDYTVEFMKYDWNLNNEAWDHRNWKEELLNEEEN